MAAARRAQLIGPKPNTCPTCHHRHGRSLTIAHCICTGDVQIGRGTTFHP